MDLVKLLKEHDALRKHTFPAPVTEQSLNEAVALGMIALDDLVDGCLYLGFCRNSRIAMWSAYDKRFHYLRLKGSVREESLNHPSFEEVLDGFAEDLFVPIAELDEPELNPGL